MTLWPARFRTVTLQTVRLRTVVSVGAAGFRFVRRVPTLFRPRAVAMRTRMSMGVVSRAFVIARCGVPLEMLTHREVPHPRRAEAVRRTGMLRMFALRTMSLRAMRLRTVPLRAVTLRTMLRAVLHRVFRAVLRTMFRSGVTRVLAVRAVFAGFVIAIRRASAIFAAALGVLGALGAIVLAVTAGRLRDVAIRTVSAVAGANVRRLPRTFGLGVMRMVMIRTGLGIRTGFMIGARLVIGTMFGIGTGFVIRTMLSVRSRFMFGATTFRAARFRLALAVGTRATCVRSGAATGKRARAAAGHQLAHRFGLVAENLPHLFVNLTHSLRVHPAFASGVARTLHEFAHLAGLVGAERFFHPLFKFFATHLHRLRIEAGATFGARFGLAHFFAARFVFTRRLAARLFFPRFFPTHFRLARLVLLRGSLFVA